MRVPHGKHETNEQAVQRVLRDSRLGRAAKLAWSHLWKLAASRPTEIIVGFCALGDELGASERSARRWIADLRAVGLIELLEVLSANRAVRLLLRHPADVLGSPCLRPGEAQRSFSFGETDSGATEEIEAPATIPFARPGQVKGSTDGGPDAA